LGWNLIIAIVRGGDRVASGAQAPAKEKNPLIICLLRRRTTLSFRTKISKIILALPLNIIMIEFLIIMV